MIASDTTTTARVSVGVIAVLGVLAATCITTFLLLSSTSDRDENLDLPWETRESQEDSQLETRLDTQPEADRVSVLAGGRGEVVTVGGFLVLDGAALSGIEVQAFTDLHDTLPDTLAQRIRTSPVYYSKVGAALQSALADVRPRDPRVAAHGRTGSDGSFTLSVPAGESLTFGLDHDFYYLPREQAGPFGWLRGTLDEGQPELELFEGRLEVELGALVRGKVTDSDGLPLENVSITLAQDMGLPFGRGFGRRPGSGMSFTSRETTSDEQGAFTLRGVPPGEELRVSAKCDGWAPGRSAQFEIAAGQIHNVTIKLAEGASIETLVRGPDGNPLQGAEVFLELDASAEASSSSGTAAGGRGGRGFGGPGGMFGLMSRQIVGVERAGLDGKVLFEALAPGAYTLRAVFSGLLESRTESPIGVTEEIAMNQVELALDQGLFVSGRVVDDEERPVAGALVEARLHADRGGRGFQGFGGFQAMEAALTTPESGLKKVRTGADGAFLLTGLADGATYDLIAEAEGHASGVEEEIDPGSRGAKIVLDRTGTFEGRVIQAATAAPVREFSIHITPSRDEDEAGGRFGGMRGDRGGRGRGGRGDEGPGGGRMDRGAEQNDPFARGRGGWGNPPEMPGGVPDAMQTVFDAVRDTMRDAFRPARRVTEREDEFNDARGRFIISDIVPGTYRLTVAAKGLAPGVTETIEVEKGERVQDIVVTLGPGGSISGVVVNPLGPVAKATVAIASKEEPDTELELGLNTIERVETDREGRFRLESLPAGTFLLQASRRDQPSGRTAAIDLDEGEASDGVTIQLPASATITGTAFDTNGVPMESQMLSCSAAGEENRRWSAKRTLSDGKGRFKFEGLTAGEYRVSLSSRRGRGGPFGGSAGSGTETTDVFVDAGGVVDVVLQKEALEGTTVHGIITSGGVAIAGGFLTVSGEDRRARRSGVINADGTYLVEGVSPGTNRFSLRFAGNDSFESSTLEFEITDVADLLLNIEIPGGTVSGIVNDAGTGLHLEGVRVTLSPKTDGAGGRGGNRFGSSKSMTTEEGGFFSFRFLAPGIYRLRATARIGDAATGETGYYPAEITGLTLSENQTLGGVNIGLVTGGGVLVIVTDRNEEPLENATITLRQLQSSIAATGESRQGGRGTNRGRTEESGEAYVSGVEPGTYSMTVQARGMGQAVLDNIVVSSGKIEKRRVILDTGHNVSVQLLDGNKQPVEGARLNLRSALGTSLSISGGRGRGASDPGVYQVGILAPGSYTLDVNWNGQSETVAFSVSGPGTISLVLRGI